MSELIYILIGKSRMFYILKSSQVGYKYIFCLLFYRFYQKQKLSSMMGFQVIISLTRLLYIDIHIIHLINFKIMKQETTNSIIRAINSPKSKGDNRIDNLFHPEQPSKNRTTKKLLPPIQKLVSIPKLIQIQQPDHSIGVNQVLKYQFKSQECTNKIFYVPCYVRVKVNRVTQINYVEVSGDIQTQIRLWVMIKEFPKCVQQQIINSAKLIINDGESVHCLSQIPEPQKLVGNYKKNVSKKVKSFYITKEMNLNIQSDPFWSPFQLIKLIATLKIKKVKLGSYNENYATLLSPQQRQLYEDATVQFNFMDAHPFINFSFGELNHLGSFDIAESLVDMEFSNEAIRDDDEDDSESENENNERKPLIGGLLSDTLDKTTRLKQNTRRIKFKKGEIVPDAYQHGRILIPLYKYPIMTIINVFLPFYLIAILNLGVFFEANDMSNRSANLAMFQLAYIAFIPTVRQNLPETPKIVFSEILIYLQGICIIICFFYSLVVNMREDYVFVWSSNPVFLVCLALTAGNILTIVILFLIHKCSWEPAYNKLPQGAIQCMQKPTINTDDPKQWHNLKCQQQFKIGFSQNLVKPAFRSSDKVVKKLSNKK